MADAKERLKKASEEHTSGYPLERVPGKARIGTYTLSMTWMGWIFYMGGPYTASLIAANMSPLAAITAIIAGNTVLVLIAIGTGIIGGKMGLSYTMISRYQFGNGGTIIPSVIIWAGATGWYGVSIGIAAAVMAGSLGGAVWLWAIIFGGLMTIMAAFGMKVISKFAFFVAPAILIMLVVAFIIAMVQMPEGQTLLPKGPFVGGNPWLLAFGLTISHFVIGASLNPDVMRFSRSKKAVSISSFMGFFVALNISMFLGVFTSWAIGTTDFFVEMPNLLGTVWKVFSILAIIGIVVTSGDLQCYSAGLALSNITKMHLVTTVLISGGIGIFLAVSGIYGGLINFLILLGIFAPGVPAIILVDFFIINKQKYPGKEHLRGHFGVAALVAWGIGALLEYILTNRLGAGVFTLNSFVIAGVLYYIFSMVLKRKMFNDQAPSASEYYLTPEEEGELK